LVNAHLSRTTQGPCDARQQWHLFIRLLRFIYDILIQPLNKGQNYINFIMVPNCPLLGGLTVYERHEFSHLNKGGLGNPRNWFRLIINNIINLQLNGNDKNVEINN